MPLSYTIDHDRDLADVRGSGKVTLDQTIHMIREIAGEISHDGLGCLVDVREMDFFPTVAELKEIAFEFIRLRAAFRAGTVFVVSNDRHYALGRFLAMLVDTAGIRMAVFKELELAEHWLHNHTGAHKIRTAREARRNFATGEQGSGSRR